MQSQKMWSYRVNAIMKREYAISIQDAGFDESDIATFFRREPEPREFVEWFAAKYDLIHVSDAGFGSHTFGE